MRAEYVTLLQEICSFLYIRAGLSGFTGTLVKRLVPERIPTFRGPQKGLY